MAIEEPKQIKDIIYSLRGPKAYTAHTVRPHTVDLFIAILMCRFKIERISDRPLGNPKPKSPNR